jgi:hypothetical protein
MHDNPGAMKDLTPLLHLLALHMKARRHWIKREASTIADYDAFLAIRSLTDRIDHLSSFIRSNLSS